MNAHQRTEGYQKPGRYGNLNYGCPPASSLSHLKLLTGLPIKNTVILESEDHAWVQQHGLPFN